LFLGQVLEVIDSQGEIKFTDVYGINPNSLINIYDKLRLKLGGFFDGFRDFFVLIQEIARINNYQARVIFFVLIEIVAFFIQPAELYSSIRSATWFGVSQQITAIGHGDAGIVCGARTVD